MNKLPVIGWASLGVRWDHVEHFRFRTSDGEVHDVHSHISNHAPYYHFGRSEALISPPPYDAELRS